LDILFGMANVRDEAAALKALQDDIYREQVLRARNMTVAQRLADVFELSNHQFAMMLGGAMHRLGTRDEAEGWREVRRRMERLDHAREAGLYVTEKTAMACARDWKSLRPPAPPKPKRRKSCCAGKSRNKNERRKASGPTSTTTTRSS
jgi:hypothetical protein